MRADRNQHQRLSRPCCTSRVHGCGGKGIMLGAHRAIAAPQHAGSEESVTKSLSAACRLSRQPQHCQSCHLWSWDITNQPGVTATGALGQDRRDQGGGRAGGTKAMLDPVSGTAPQSCPTCATQRCPGCPQPPSRLRWQQGMLPAAPGDRELLNNLSPLPCPRCVWPLCARHAEEDSCPGPGWHWKMEFARAQQPEEKVLQSGNCAFLRK